MSTIELPKDWEKSGIDRHIENPWSDAALAEPEKGVIALAGLLDWEECREACLPGSDIKAPNEGLRTTRSAGINHANEGFAVAAEAIVGEDNFLRAMIDLRFLLLDVPPSCLAGVGGAAHLDAAPEHATKPRQSRLIGIACDVLPTIMYQGPIKWSEFDKRGTFKGNVTEDRFERNEIDLGVINLMPPALLHGPTQNDTGKDALRLFMRWTLIY